MANRIKEYVEMSYKQELKQYVYECKAIIDTLEMTIKRARKNQFHGNPFSSNFASSVSERYGILRELQEILSIKED